MDMTIRGLREFGTAFLLTGLGIAAHADSISIERDDTPTNSYYNPYANQSGSWTVEPLLRDPQGYSNQVDVDRQLPYSFISQSGNTYFGVMDVPAGTSAQSVAYGSQAQVNLGPDWGMNSEESASVSGGSTWDGSPYFGGFFSSGGSVGQNTGNTNDYSDYFHSFSVNY
jgi:hypothetical protein